MHWDILLRKNLRNLSNYLRNGKGGHTSLGIMLQLSHLLQEGFSLDESKEFLSIYLMHRKVQIEQMRRIR